MIYRSGSGRKELKMQFLNGIVRRIFAWPLILIGSILVDIGGCLIKAGAWAVDIDYKAIMEEE
jgi:hypothetical protein